jgi:hypothetical protein
VEYQVVTGNSRISNSEYRTPKFPPEADPPSVGRTSRFCGWLFVNLRFPENSTMGNRHEDQGLALMGESALPD